MEFKLIAILGALCMSAVLMSFAHAYDWKKVFGRNLTPPWSYVAGVLFLAVPYTALMILWHDWWALGAATAVVAGGGFSVIFGYNIRGKTEKPDYQILLSEHLADEREISLGLRRKLMERERENASLIAKLCTTEGDDGP